MLELVSSTYTIEQLEDIFKKLVNKGLAVQYKEPFKKDESGKIDRESNKAYSSGYDLERAYQVFVAPSPYTFGGRVNVRFWYNKRTTSERIKIDQGSIKITREGLQMLTESMTVIGLLQKLNLKLANGKKSINLETMGKLLSLVIKDTDKIEKVTDDKLVLKTKGQQ